MAAAETHTTKTVELKLQKNNYKSHNWHTLICNAIYEHVTELGLPTK